VTTWPVVTSPDPSAGGNYLDAVTAVSTNDVWAVGTSDGASGGSSTLVDHWNGNEWSVVTSPTVDIDDSLESVSAVDASDVWAVGDDFENTSGGSLVLTLTLTEHFDGSQWTVVASPSPTDDNNLLAVTAVAHHVVWAVGGSSGYLAALVEHWDGTQWAVADEPYRHGDANFLCAVSHGSGSGVWAAGALGGAKTLALHYCTS
jgi:hypothetical protein